MNKSLLSLIKAYKAYIKLLSEDIESNHSFLLAHNILCPEERVLNGIRLRGKIEKLEKENDIK